MDHRVGAVAVGLLLSLAVGVGVLAAAGEGGGERYDPRVDPAAFTTTITNPYLPLRVGTRWVYAGRTEDGLEGIVVEVTDQTRVVMGVPCVVVRDVVTRDGQLYEETLDWFAQHRDGSVWYFGEETRQRTADGSFTPAGSWEAGKDGALPGVVMPARPQPGGPYRQEYLPGEAEDMGRVLRADDDIRVPFGFFRGVVVTRDWSPLDPGVVEQKYYAPGVGLVREEVVQGGAGRADLVEVTTAAS